MNVILEILDNGLFRCTVRHHGATMAFVDHSEPRQAVLAAMRQGAAGHILHDGSFDMTSLQLNDAAKQALAPAPDSSKNALCTLSSSGRDFIKFPPDSSNRVLSFMRVDGRWIGTERVNQEPNSARVIPVCAEMSSGLNAIWQKNKPA